VKIDGSNGAGRPPDFRVKVGLRGQGFHKQIGAAWKLKSGGVSVKLDPGLALVSGTDVVITLWPSEQEQRPQTTNHQDPHWENDHE
jgi:uncharacterized protein (DUF736 family)